MRRIQITAASRLHFGMLAPGATQGRRFGGAGVMITVPPLCLSVSASICFECVGPGAERVHESAESWRSSRGDPLLPECRIRVESLPPLHTGLGVGTQLGLSVARGLNEFRRVGDTTPAELAASVRRGNRSAVGTYGFFEGGLIAESGKANGEPLARLEARQELPDAWRWLLVCPRNGGGLHGDAEQRAFADLPEGTCDLADDLSSEMRDQLLPAARQADFDKFSASLHRFGYQSGLRFKSVQGGAYNGPRLQRIVATIRALGIEGVGQSSWGPTIFALCPDDSAAQACEDQLRRRLEDIDVTISTTCNQGAQVEIFD